MELIIVACLAISFMGFIVSGAWNVFLSLSAKKGSESKNVVRHLKELILIIPAHNEYSILKSRLPNLLKIHQNFFENGFFKSCGS